MAKPLLYNARICPFCHRCRLALREKGIEYELREIDLRSKPDWFVDISPFGTVPALRHEGLVLWESAIINEYLDEMFPGPLLLPKEPARRARARLWIDFADSRFVPLFYRLLREQDPDRWAAHRETIAETFRFMETRGISGHSETGPFWLGPQVSLVDLAFYPWIERWPVLKHYRRTALPDDCPKLARWWSALEERAMVREEAQPQDFFIERYRDYAEGRK